MAREKKTSETPKKKNLNVAMGIGECIDKIATHRRLTIEQFFEEQDVQEFFKHLLIAEMRKEEQRLKGKS